MISRIHQQGVFANKNAVSILQSGLHILVLAINALSLQNSSHVSYNTEITFSQENKSQTDSKIQSLSQSFLPKFHEFCRKIISLPKVLKNDSRKCNFFVTPGGGWGQRQL